jgi:SAM-dependent methyltransferase
MQVQYEGHEQLSIMSYATLYNKTLFKWINHECDSECKILDFGAGIGEFSNRFENQNRINVIELDDAQLLMNKTENRFSTIESLEDREFDLIYSSNVLEHIENDQEIVRQLNKHLKVGGEFRIFVPAKMILYSSMDRAVGHHRRYEKEELIALFSSLDLEVYDCRYFDFLGYFVALLYKFIGSKEGDISKKSILIYDRVVFPISHFIDKITFGKIIGKNLMLKARKR